MHTRPEWLKLCTEEALEPELPIVDAHHHLLDQPSNRYLFDDYREDAESGHQIIASVFVECRSMYRQSGPDELKPVGETGFVAGVAAQNEGAQHGPNRLCAAIVANVDFSLGARFDTVIEQHIAASDGRLRGFRGRSAWDKDTDLNRFGTLPHVLLRDDTATAVAGIAKRGYPLDIWVYQTQLDEIVNLGRRFPDLQIIVDHVGGPLGCGPYHDRRQEMFPAWAQGIKKVAELPNVSMKFSGLGTRYPGFLYDQASHPPSSDQLTNDWRPYFEICLEAFGPRRCMFASNFPGDKSCFSFTTLWNSFKKLSRSLSHDERKSLLSETATRVYRIPR